MYISSVKRITLFTLLFFLVSKGYGQDHCVYRPYIVSSLLAPGESGELVVDDYLKIYTDSIEFDGLKYPIQDLEKSPFTSKDDLLRYFSCNYDFFNASENIYGTLNEYSFNVEIPRIGSTFQFIQFWDAMGSNEYIYTKDGLYRFGNIPLFIGSTVNRLVKSSIESEFLNYAFSVDTSAVVYYVEEPEFELVTEQFLLKEASSSLEVIPAVYQDEYIEYYHEISNCAAAVYDTLYEQVLVKEGTYQFEIIPAVFETVTEYRAVQNEFEGHFFYERMMLDSISIPVEKETIEVAKVNINPGCSEFSFFDCAEIVLDTIPGKDTTLYNVFEICEEGYQSAGKYCYHNTGTVPYKWELRSYEKLREPAHTKLYEIPNEYTTLSYTRIINKDDLDSNCVQTVVDSVLFQKLITPPTTNAIEIPAEYETLQYNYYQDGGVIEVVEGEPDSSFEIEVNHGGVYHFIEDESVTLMEDKACFKDAISSRLVAEGYLNEGEKDKLLAFQEAVIRYQIEHELPLGVIDGDFVNMLDVKFGY